jgi:hypothetical protein
MIRTKNVGQVILQFALPGAFTTGQTSSNIVPFAGFISNLYARRLVGTLSTTFDILKNGTTIFSVLPIIGTTGLTISSTGTATAALQQVAAGDVLQVVVTDIGAGAPLNFAAAITISKYNPAGAGMTMQADHDTVL